MHDIPTILRELHGEYAERVNLAISEDRDDIVEALSAEFTDAALAALLDAGHQTGLSAGRGRKIR